jgi:hypothetical protein
MIEDAKLPKNLWAEALLYHVWIRNRVPTRALQDSKTPLEMATGRKPDLSTVHPWGCKAWVKRLDVGKLEPRAVECRFVGIDTESKGYRIYWPGKNRVGIERDVYFNENEALEPEEVQIEGGNDIPANSNLPQPSHNVQSDPFPLQPVQPVLNEPEIQPEVHEPNEAPVNAPINQPNDPENPSVAPHERIVRRNSLSGLPQYDNEQFGRGKRKRVATK